MRSERKRGSTSQNRITTHDLDRKLENGGRRETTTGERQKTRDGTEDRERRGLTLLGMYAQHKQVQPRSQ